VTTTPEPPGGDITALLAEARGGDHAAFDRVFEMVYGELRTIARRQLRRSAASTLDTTGLVHEVYLKFSRQEAWSVNDRVHFYRLAARAMRNIVIDLARSRDRQRRGGELQRVELDDDIAAPVTGAEELLAIDGALGKLEALDPELAQLVEWRVYGGLSVEEIAGLWAVSDRTVKRRWRMARAHLYRELGGEGAPP
jgi:RNA polymerase sigma factor (TIGR02999 family)